MTRRLGDLIEYYSMEFIPVEGTYVKKIYESNIGMEGKRACSMMVGLHSNELDSFSALHRLTSEEIWTYLEGDPLELILLDGEGNLETVVLGSDFEQGQQRTYVVRPGVWQAAKSLGEYTLYSCTVVPAFTSSCFEGADKSLLDKYEEHRDVLADFIPKGKYLPEDYKG